MRKYIAQLFIVCVLLSIVGCGRAWNNPVESAVPLENSPTLLEPSNNCWIWNNGDTINYKWNKVENATKYKIHISKNQNFDTVIVEKELTENNYLWLDTITLGRLFWYVEAWNPVGVWVKSNINSFERGPYCVGEFSSDKISTERVVKKISNDYVYIIDSPFTTIINISDINSPYFVKDVSMSGFYSNYALLNNNILFLYGQGLASWNVTDPLNPQQIWGVGFQCTGLAIKDSILFAIDILKNLRVYNISNLTNPTLIDTLHLNIYEAHFLAIKDSILFIANGSSGIALVNVANINNPAYIKTISTSNAVYNFTIVGNKLYCATSMQIYDISNPTQPTLLYTNSLCNNWTTFISDDYIIYSDTFMKVNDIVTNQPIGRYAFSSSLFDYAQKYAYCYTPWGSNQLGFKIVKVIP